MVGSEALGIFFSTLNSKCANILKHFFLNTSSKNIDDLRYEITQALYNYIQSNNQFIFEDSRSYRWKCRNDLSQISKIICSDSCLYPDDKDNPVIFVQGIRDKLRDAVRKYIQTLYTTVYVNKKVKVKTYNLGYIYIDLSSVLEYMIIVIDETCHSNDSNDSNDSLDDYLYKYGNIAYVESTNDKVLYDIDSIGGNEVAAYLSENKCDDWMYYACAEWERFEIQNKFMNEYPYKCNTLYTCIEFIIKGYSKTYKLLQLRDGEEPTESDVCKEIIKYASTVDCSTRVIKSLQWKLKRLGIPVYETDVMVHYANGHSFEESIALSYMEVMYFLTDYSENMAGFFKIKYEDRYKHIADYLCKSREFFSRSAAYSGTITFRKMLRNYMRGKQAGNKITKEELDRITGIIRKLLKERRCGTAN